MALFPFGTIVNFFIHRFVNLSAGEPAKMCQTRKMRSQMFASGGQWNQKYEHGFIHLVILLESPPMRCITKRHWSCFAPFCFLSLICNRRVWHKAPLALCKDCTK
jgi:hypothetical protein